MSAANGGEADLAPVIPLFGAQPELQPEHAPERAPLPEREPRPQRERDVPEHDAAEAAEQTLLRRLRTRSLSIAEARRVVREHGLDDDAVEAVLDVFRDRGYLDDAALAEQLVHAGVDRKGQGRHAIAQTLAQRGIPRDVVDAALAELPDDDAERALEYARRKAGAMRGLERDVALRRLAGQLARRGYGGRSLEAARTALDELAGPRRAGVRFDG